MKKSYIIYFALLFSLIQNSSCQEIATPTNQEISAIGYVIALDSLASAADILDSDMESLWAYSEAKKQLDSASICATQNKIQESYSRIWSASSYITYGLSYTRTIKRHSSLEKLSSLIISPIKEGMNPDQIGCLIDEQEEKAISGWVYYYTVADMPMSTTLEQMKIEKEKSRNYIISNFDASAAHRMLQTENVVYGFKVYSTLFSDLYSSLNLISTDSINNRITEWANTIDNIPTSPWELSTMTDSLFNEYYLPSQFATIEMLSSIAEGVGAIKSKEY